MPALKKNIENAIIHIGERSSVIHSTVIAFGPIKLGRKSYIGPYCVLGFPANEELLQQQRAQRGKRVSISKMVTVGANTNLLSHVVVGEETTIGGNVWCDHHTYIGCSTKIDHHVQIMYGTRIYDRVQIKENCWIGGFICNDAVIEANSIVMGKLIHKFIEADEEQPEKAPIVREGAFVGMNAIVIGDVEVGTMAYISAGAVLTKSANPGRLYVGVPARDVGPAPSAFRNKMMRRKRNG